MPRRAARPRATVGIVVLAKHPRPGQVKTRLARTIGVEAACALYRAGLRDLASRLRRLGVPVWWAYTPASAPFAALVRTRRCFAQVGGDLGARIAHALATVRRRGCTAAIAIGADVPHVSRRTLLAAADALRGDADVVLGPARDGGYYLIGLRASAPALFRDVPWGGRRVLAVTRRRCRGLGLQVTELPAGFDVDDARDVVALRRIVRSRPDEFRCLRHLFAGPGAAVLRRQRSS